MGKVRILSVFMLLMIALLVIASVVYAYAAYHGDWAEQPYLGNWWWYNVINDLWTQSGANASHSGRNDFPPAYSGDPMETDVNDVHPLEDVAYYAALQIREFAQADETGEFRSWQGATVGEITLVRDAAGDPVLYDVIVQKNGRTVGLIQIWAKKLMGMPFYTASTSTVLLDLRQRLAEARKIATQILGEINITESEMVYYRFPKRAFAITFRRGGQTSRVLVDVTTQRIVAPDEVVPFASIISADALRESREEWEHIRKLLDQTEQPRPTGWVEKQLNVPLFAQQYDYYCGPAAVKMIFHYRHGWSHSQDYYAHLLGTTPEGGTPWENYGPAWQRLGHYIAYFNGRVPWEIVKNEINGNRPFQSHIGGHVRVARGYREWLWWKYVLINDPWPTGQGNTFWESYPTYWAGTILVY
jgi:hypothetical protein